MGLDTDSYFDVPIPSVSVSTPVPVSQGPEHTVVVLETCPETLPSSSGSLANHSTVPSPFWI